MSFRDSWGENFILLSLYYQFQLARKSIWKRNVILVRIFYCRDQDETWFKAGSSWLKVTPWGIRQAIAWASRQYNQPDIYITENGFSDLLSNLDDLQR